jgi:hypothetical protein
MNSYDLLGLMDTYNTMVRENVPNTPSTLTEFLTGITPIDDGQDIQTPQLGQGNTTYEQGIDDVEARDKTADLVTNRLGVGQSHTGSAQLDQFIPLPKRPHPQHAEAMEHKDRLDVRRKVGYDK